MTAAGARHKRWRRAAIALALAVALVLGVAAGHAPILRSLGSALVAQDPLAPADVIVVTLDAGAAGMLEAADLVHASVAPRVALFAEPPGAVDAEFIRRGFRVENKVVMWRRMLAELGVTDVIEIPVSVNGTEAEGVYLPRWCAQQGLRSIIVVTTPDHSRRVRRVMRREMKGQPTRVSVRPARISAFDPDVWWQSRGGLRTGIVELEKLLLDGARHPIF